MNYHTSDAANYLQYTDYQLSPMHRNRLCAIVKMLSGRFDYPAQTSILDIGCGRGNIAAPIASLGYNVLGIDIHAGSVDAARRSNTFPNAQFDVLKLEDVDISTFDAVILSEVFEHVIQADEMLNYIATHLKPGALLILTVPNGWSIVEMACRPSYVLKRSKMGARFVEAVKRMLGSKDMTTANEQTPHVQFFRLSRLHRLFRKAGLKTRAFEAIFFAWPLWEIFFTKLLSEQWAKRDFLFAAHLPNSLRAIWCFCLEKELH